MTTDYLDPIYTRLAKKSQRMIQQDPELSQLLFQQGMTFVCDGRPSRFTEVWESQLTRGKSSDPESYVELFTREEVFQRIHGKNSQPPPLSNIGGDSRWNRAYCNLEDAFIDAKESIQIYYDRCLKASAINFMCGSAVERIQMVDDIAQGVILQDGNIIQAELVVVAAGAWSNKLVYLGTRMIPIGHEVAWIKVSAEEEARWKNMSITTNMSTGLNMFPPYNGEIKILRRSPGYKNTTIVPHPEDRSKKIQISYPRTIVSNPADVIPSDAEAAMRENLREIMPTLADRPFDRTKICW
jgi:sarcosine oxidase/L-pipecolate oxidase